MKRSLIIAAAVLAASSPAVAQSRFEIGGAATWTGGYDAGGTDASLSRPATGSAPLTLFSTSSAMDAAAGVAARAAYSFTPRLAAEGFVEYSRPTLRTTIANDFENATGTEATNAMTSLLVGGSVRFALGGARLAPFVFGGGGWLRQIDEDRIEDVSGGELHAGGGLFFALSPRLRFRADAGVSSRDRSAGFEDRRRVLPVVSAGLAYRW